MNLSEISLFKAFRSRGHIAAVLKLSLPALSACEEVSAEACERFSSFYNRLSEEYCSAVQKMLSDRSEKAGAILPMPIRIAVSFTLREVDLRKRKRLIVERKTVITEPQAAPREFLARDEFDLAYGVFVK